jgi:plastocyanin
MADEKNGLTGRLLLGDPNLKETGSLIMIRLPLAVASALAGLVGLVASPVAAAAAPPEVALTIEEHRFQPDEIRVKAGAPFVLVIANRDSGPEEFDSTDLRIEKVIPAGKTVRLRLPALKPGTYPFVGEYHEKTAKGRIVAE